MPKQFNPVGWLFICLLVASSCQKGESDDSQSSGSATVLGCTDSNACNYDPLATENDGSCEFGGVALSFCDDGDPNTVNDAYDENGCNCEGVVSPCSDNSSISYDGHDYAIAIVGPRCWFVENLRANHFNDGSEIPEVSNSEDWVQLESPACKWNDPGNMAPWANQDPYAYGRLYNTHTVYSGKNPCPEGWHVAYNTDFNKTIAEFGGEYTAGFKFKTTTDWFQNETENGNGDNSSGWNGFPEGFVSATTGNAGLRGATSCYLEKANPEARRYRKLTWSDNEFQNNSLLDSEWAFGGCIRCVFGD